MGIFLTLKQAGFAITTCAYFYSQHGSSLYNLTLGAVKHQLSLCRDCSPKASPCSPCLPIALPWANKSAKEDFLQWEPRNSTKINRSCWWAQIQVVSLSGLQGRIWLCYWQRPSISSRVENVVRSCKLSLFSSYSVAILMSPWSTELKLFFSIVSDFSVLQSSVLLIDLIDITYCISIYAIAVTGFHWLVSAGHTLTWNLTPQLQI